MSRDKKNILFVGGSGYLGSHLRTFFPSCSVYYTSTSEKEDAIVLDLQKEETFQNISNNTYDTIFLLASSLKGLGTKVLKEEFINTDTIGLAQFLQFVHDNKLTKKLVYTSSMTVYGSQNENPVNENSTIEPLSTYGLSKSLGEKIFSFYCNSNSVPGVILRIPGIYGGERKNGYIYNTVTKCINNQLIELNTSELGYWETIHINDLCSWIAEFEINYPWNQSAQIFNIGYGIKTDFIECAQLIKEITGSSSAIVIKGEKGYNDFYLDNKKIQAFAAVRDNYKESLAAYIKTFRQ